MSPSQGDLIVQCDGASFGNPGPAGIGVAIYGADGKLIRSISKPIGRTTNNQAEYLALISALEAVNELSPSSVHIRVDSELVARQVLGQYAVRSPDLRPLHRRVLDLLRALPKFRIASVPRERNSMADRLAKQGAREQARLGALTEG